MVAETWLGVTRHLGAGLSAKVLNDDFLEVSISFVQSSELEQSGEALPAGFADADEDAGRERNGRFAGSANDFETHGGMLIRRAEMRTAARAKSFRRTLQHQTLRHGNTPQRRKFAGAHDPGIKVREEAGFLRYQCRHLSEVRNSRVVPELGQLRAGRTIALFRLITQGEERLAASGCSAAPGDGEHFFLVQ